MASFLASYIAICCYVCQSVCNFANSLKFLLKKTNTTTFSGLRQLCRLVTVNPAVEKSLSFGVEVGGIHKMD